MRRAVQLRWGPVLAAGLLGIAYLAMSPASGDMAGHTYRTGLWERDGFTVWNAQWYGGHHVLGYSLLFSPLASLLGPRLVGVLGGVAATALFAAAARRRAPSPGAAAAASWLFSAAAMSHVVIGRMPFVLGLAFAVGAWVCADGSGAPRRAAAAALSLAAAWTSPVAGGLVVLAAAGRWLGGERREALVLALPGVAGGFALALAFPEGGADRFIGAAFWPMLALSVAALALMDPARRALRLAIVLYLGLLVLSYAVPNPLGQNTLRYGVTLGPPLLALAARRNGSRWTGGAVLAVGAGLMYLAWLPAVRAVTEAAGDPSVRAGFHADALHFLRAAVRPGERVEVPLTRNHWEAAYLAPSVPLARGWERQLDVKVNPLFYDGRRLTPQRYRRWLHKTGVGFVALPAAPLDVSAKAEARLLARPPAFLEPEYRSPRWRIWRVTGAEAAPRLVEASPQGFEVRAAAPGPVVVRERHTPYWTVQSGDACLRRTGDGFTEIDARQAGLVRVHARLSLHGALHGGPACSG